jgi:hypothetical protein
MTWRCRRCPSAESGHNFASCGGTSKLWIAFAWTKSACCTDFDALSSEGCGEECALDDGLVTPRSHAVHLGVAHLGGRDSRSGRLVLLGLGVSYADGLFIFRYCPGRRPGM